MRERERERGVVGRADWPDWSKSKRVNVPTS